MTMADRIAVMDHGRFVQIDPPNVISEQPDSRYVADFIGDVNFIEGHVASHTRGVVKLDTNASKTAIAAHSHGIDVAKGDTAWVALRPEKVRIGLDKPTGRNANAISGEVWDIAYLGDLSIYHVKLDSGEVVKSAQTNQTRMIERPITWDDRVWLSWDRDAGVLLTR